VFDTPWVRSLLGGLGLLYDDIAAMIAEEKAAHPELAQVIEAVASQLQTIVGEKVKDVPALAALLVAQFTAGGSDPDAGADV
jgi:hypothetical protein